MPARSAATTWFRMRAKRGETMTVGPPAPAEERSGDEVHRRLAPAGPLDDQRPSVSDDEGFDGIPLILPQTGVIPRQCTKELLGLRAKGRTVCDGHRGNRTPEVYRRIGRAPGFTLRPRRGGSPRGCR